MRPLALLLALAASLAAAVSPEFASRRAALRKSVPDGVVVLFGARESDDLHQPFFQQSDFYYLTGWEEPNAILILTPEPDPAEPAFAERSRAPREIFLLPQRVLAEEKWTGRKLGPSDPNAAAIAGVAEVLPAERLESELRALLDLYPNLYTAGGDQVAQMFPRRTVIDVRPKIAALRMVKSEAEIALIQKATDSSVAAHRAAWKAIHPGQFEYETEALMSSVWLAEGCRRPAYAPIIGSGPNSATLHYSRNNRQMDAGEVVVMDVAAECSYYASDITRTIPVGGKFTPRQREIYKIVLGAHDAAVAAVKPGALIGRNGLYKIAFDYIDTHGKDLHGEPLGKYFNHGLSHHVGLDVHDSSDNTVPLKPGMVVTIEPGIYIPEENIGVRIEDTLLVTEDGARVMSAALPTDPDEIERALARK